MTTFENIIGNYNRIKEGDLTHRRHFLNPVNSTRGSWYHRRRFAI